jgi:hypothetical protein
MSSQYMKNDSSIGPMSSSAARRMSRQAPETHAGEPATA